MSTLGCYASAVSPNIVVKGLCNNNIMGPVTVAGSSYHDAIACIMPYGISTNKKGEEKKAGGQCVVRTTASATDHANTISTSCATCLAPKASYYGVIANCWRNFVVAISGIA
jgi:hypothetical protein